MRAEECGKLMVVSQFSWWQEKNGTASGKKIPTCEETESGVFYYSINQLPLYSPPFHTLDWLDSFAG